MVNGVCVFILTKKSHQSRIHSGRGASSNHLYVPDYRSSYVMEMVSLRMLSNAHFYNELLELTLSFTI